MGRICPSLLVRRQTAGPQYKNMTISKILTSQRHKIKRKYLKLIISTILEKVAELLDWTKDPFEAGILRIIADAFGDLDL